MGALERENSLSWIRRCEKSNLVYKIIRRSRNISRKKGGDVDIDLHPPPPHFLWILICIPLRCQFYATQAWADLGFEIRGGASFRQGVFAALFGIQGTIINFQKFVNIITAKSQQNSLSCRNIRKVSFFLFFPLRMDVN